MEFRHLRYFIAVAEERSFTRAARRLWMAQPGLSVQIKQLERELGTPLFERHSRGAELTPAGELFLERARLVLREVRATAAADEGGPWTETRLRVGLCAATPWPQSKHALAQIDIQEGGGEIDLVEGCGGSLWNELRARGLDVLIGSEHLASPDLQALSLGAAPWGIVVDGHHRLAGGDGPVSINELEGEAIAVSGQRDAAAYDRAALALLDDHAVSASVTSVPAGRTPGDAVVGSSMIALTTEPVLYPRGAHWRELSPRTLLGFVALWIDPTPQPTLARFLAQLHPGVELVAETAPVV